MNDVHRSDRFETITPEDFEPSGGGTGGAEWGRRALLGAVFLALFLLVFGAWFMFTGRSVQIAITPAPETVDLDGGLMRINLGDRWLLRPGDYVLDAELPGYYPLAETIEVTSAPDQRFELEMVRLPGYLTLSVAPAEATVLLDGEPMTLPVDDLELRPGTYPLHIEAPRYQPLDTELEIVGGGERQTASYELMPDWGNVTVESEPPGATLHVDGEPVGETPLTAQILSGRHVVELRLEGYKPWEQRLAVAAMEDVSLPPVALEKADHVVRATSVPAGASVAVDGEYRGQTPLELALRPGDTYRVVFSKPGYESNQRELDVVQGDEATLAVRLKPVLGTVTVVGSPDNAEVLVDGVRRGRVNQPLELPSHPQRIEVVAEGHEPFRTTVTPNPQREQRVEVALLSHEARERLLMPDVLDTSIGYQLKLFRPSGIFRMGSPRREQGRRSNEFMRQVQLERPFYMGYREVTNEQFARFMAQHDSGVVERETLSLKKQPVVRVPWNDAARFCNWLSDQEGLPHAYSQVDDRMVPVSPMTTGYRLPTEAEWVLVARYEGQSEGRAARKYAWGDSMPPPRGAANLAGVEAAGLVDNLLTGYDDPYPATAQVGELAADAAGLFDFGGNVSEWIHDFYLIRIPTGSIPVDPTGPDQGETHVIRGPSWRSGSITELRLAWRGEGTEARDDIGFRVARYAE